MESRIAIAGALLIGVTGGALSANVLLPASANEARTVKAPSADLSPENDDHPGDCAALASVVDSTLPLDTVYDPATGILELRGEPGWFRLSVTDDECRARSPIIEGIVKDAVATDQENRRSECEVMTRMIKEAPPGADTVGVEGKPLEIDKLELYLRDIC